MTASLWDWLISLEVVALSALMVELSCVARGHRSTGGSEGDFPADLGVGSFPDSGWVIKSNRWHSPSLSVWRAVLAFLPLYTSQKCNLWINEWRENITKGMPWWLTSDWNVAGMNKESSMGASFGTSRPKYQISSAWVPFQNLCEDAWIPLTKIQFSIHCTHRMGESVISNQ